MLFFFSFTSFNWLLSDILKIWGEYIKIIHIIIDTGIGCYNRYKFLFQNSLLEFGLFVWNKKWLICMGNPCNWFQLHWYPMQMSSYSSSPWSWLLFASGPCSLSIAWVRKLLLNGLIFGAHAIKSFISHLFLNSNFVCNIILQLLYFCFHMSNFV